MEETQLLKRFDSDSKWFHENINKLRENNLTGKFVAVKDEKPIAENENLDIVVTSLEKQGENPSTIFIEFVYPEGTTILF